MRYWQAGGESEKTSMRVKAAHTQMTADGLWRGGKKPFGYKLVHNGRIGKKNRPLYDLEIDEVEGPIAQEVFDLICHQGYGTLRAANYLNERYSDLGKLWTAQTIRSMLRNVIYTGRMHMNDALSEPIESLRLVSDEEQQFAMYALESRIPRKYAAPRRKQGALLKASQAELAKLHQQQTRLRQEVLKSLSGDSAFDTELLKSMLAENTQAITDAEVRVEQHQAEQAQAEPPFQSCWQGRFFHFNGGERSLSTTILALANQKCGVGKTTSTINLGVGLAQQGKKVLPVDCAPRPA